MAGLNVGDIVQVTMRGLVNGQTTLTTFHYQMLTDTTTGDYQTAIQNFADGFDAGTSSPGLALLACSSEDWKWVSTRAQAIYPTRKIYADSVVDLPGLREGPCHAQNVSAVITKRGGLAGRKYVGGTHIPGIAADDYSLGLVSPTLKAAMAVAAARYKLVYTPTVGGGESRMIIYNRSNPALSLGIGATTIQPELRVMRRRTVGLGI